MMRGFAVPTVFFGLLVPHVGFAAGGHDSISCEGCHGIHTAKGRFIFPVEPNKLVTLDGGQAVDEYSGLCLGCQAPADKGGMEILPVSRHTSHPFGSKTIDFKKAVVPDGLLRNGAFTCVSCHDPHMSNTNYKYLRVSTNGGSENFQFCALCHPAKADPSVAAKTLTVFSSMDESGHRVNTVQN